MSTTHGVYIHIPFCAKKCDYCAFATFVDKSHLIGEYLAALRLDIQRNSNMSEVTSVFIGGGTPTLLPPEDLIGVLSELNLARDAEITIECNPDDLTLQMAKTFAQGGVNRLSIGVQSTVAHVLHSLGRTHSPENIFRAVESVRGAGFTNFNLDIIYGAALEKLPHWETTLTEILRYDPPHVSAYALTIEPNTALFSQPDRHPNDDDQADKYELADELLTRSGLLNYEISNWAKPGFECRHNLLYWSQGNYTGFGSAAHSHLNGRRWWNVRTPERYIDLIAKGESPESASETLDDSTRQLEALQLLVRTRHGVSAKALSEVDLRDMSELVEVRGDQVFLTRAGRLLANEVSIRLRVTDNDG